MLTLLSILLNYSLCGQFTYSRVQMIFKLILRSTYMDNLYEMIVHLRKQLITSSGCNKYIICCIIIPSYFIKDSKILVMYYLNIYVIC